MTAIGPVRESLSAGLFDNPIMLRACAVEGPVLAHHAVSLCHTRNMTADSIAATDTSDTEKRWDGCAGSVVYALMPPHAVGHYTSVTPGGTVGVSFSGHRRAVARLAGAPVSELHIGPGDAFVSWSGDTEWLRVAEPAEAMEVRFHPRTIASALDGLETSRPPAVGDAAAVKDAVVWSICARLRAALLDRLPADALEMEARLTALAGHVMTEYAGLRPRRQGTGKLGVKRLARVTDFVDDNLGRPISLAEMAQAAALSVFHFSRAFRHSTGMPPHQFVVARKMQRARQMLMASDKPVETIAAAVGYASLPHFRASFSSHFGSPPASLRSARRGPRRR